MKHHTWLAGIAATVLSAGVLPTRAQPVAAPEVFRLQWQTSGVRAQIHGFRPQSLTLAVDAPKGLKRAPEGIESAYYGVIKLGLPDAPREFLVVADAPKGKIAKLFLDANGNGDFADDSACAVTNRVFTKPDGTEASRWQASGDVMIPAASGDRRGRLVFYGFQSRPAHGDRGAMAALNFYTDYGLVGEVTIAGRKIPAILDDAGACGYFKIVPASMANPLLWLGVENPGTRRVGMMVPAQKPFEVGGNWWTITNLALDGSFQIAAATKPPTVAKPADDKLNPGKKAPAFTAKLTDGRTVKFPDDYRGKVVLLDFWATWCGPCVAEIPNVVKAYGRYHTQGLEILGISLDKEGAETKLADFTKQKSMPWPQVYDGKFWQADVAKLYGITAIPHMLLVDGDTGEILANKTIRGDALAPAIEKGLAARKK